MKKYPQEDRKNVILKYCAYRERCHKEVRTRLLAMGASYDETGELIVQLIALDYLNEERYAKAFCRGKFLHNQWGKIKIVSNLKLNEISPYCIKIGLKEINDEDYASTLESLIRKKFDKLKSYNIYTRRDKCARSVITKGYEADLVWNILKGMEDES